MNQDIEDEVQNDQEIKKIGKELTKKVSNDAKRTASQAGRAIKKGIKKAWKDWKAKPPKVKLLIIIALVILGLIIAAVTFIYKLYRDNSISGAAVNTVIEDNVKVVKADDNQGYYFKIDKEIIDNYKKALNQAYAEGWYDVDLDSMLDKEEDENSEEETEDEEKDKENDDDVEFDDDDITYWFKTDDKSQFKSYLVKMIKAHLASSYPKLGYYYGEESDNEMDKRLDNRLDKDEDYVAQGTIKIKRTKMTAIKSDEQAGQVSGNDKYALLNTPNKKLGFSYCIVEPENVQSKKNLPLVVFLHGGGQDNYNSIKNLSITKYVTTGKAYESGEFIFFAPIIKAWSISDIKGYIDKIVKEYDIDKDRISLVGVSSGGDLAWRFINSYPDYLANDIIISTITSVSDIDVDNYMSTPIWILCRNRKR